MQSALPDSPAGLHVAIIMDGNGRWASARGLPRVAGHRAGGESVSNIVESAPRFGIATLTLYAFSSDNWQRPKTEVAALMQLLRDYLKRETRRCVKNGVRVNVIGRRDRLPADVIKAIQKAEARTAAGATLNLRIAIDYSARDSIVTASSMLNGRLDALPGDRSRETFTLALREAIHDTADAGDVDLLIRTGGEKRLSDFLLWESAYAELLFVDTMWPDFREANLEAAIQQFHSRERRFGRVAEASPVAV
ncbi:MAG TPA: di-trans,poly-cis-decaprenylcistransferase [Blastocatellia bacterium]|nr:di-trans,poly-cis-decaprenylcistransferase [Blastocatellia bacterium]